MKSDLLTLYGLAIGTLIVCAGMTLWERRARRERSAELRLWATGYLVLSLGCGLAIARTHLPSGIGWALSNLVILTGYLLILNGVARLDGQLHPRRSLVLLILVGLAWAVGGSEARPLFWNYGSALPIAAISGITAWLLLRSRAASALGTRLLPAVIAGLHATFYLLRALLLPVLVRRYGDGILAPLAEATLYEGVLYSVAMPMALLALIREEAQGELHAVSRTDYLTGLGNRQRFFEEGGAILAKRDTASLLAFDLDHFKAINDRHGHAAGDEVLKSFAQIVRDTVDAGALLVRLGGEEFAALLPGLERERAQQVGRLVAQRFAAKGHGAHGTIRATVSIGLAELGADGRDLATLLATADRALYSAKALGRNRIELAPPLAAAACA